MSDENFELKLYSPLTGDLYQGGQHDESDMPLTLSGDELLPFHDVILNALREQASGQSNGLDLMSFFDAWYAPCEKVTSVCPTIEIANGKLYGVSICKTNDILKHAELYDLKTCCEQQYSDGWGKIFEQLALQTSSGELHIHFWQNADFRIRTAKEMGLSMIPAIQSGITHIDNNSFWTLIAKAKECCGHDTGLRAEWLCKELMTLSTEEVVRFHAIFSGYKNAANRYSLWNAATIMNNGGCSDDSFIDFRAWLVTQGKDVYMNALKSPDSLADVAVHGDCTCESAGYVAAHAYEQQTGGDIYSVSQPQTLRQEIEHITGEIVYDNKTNYPMEWNEIASHFPRLCEKYLSAEQLALYAKEPMWNYDSPNVKAALIAAGKLPLKEKKQPKRGGDAR